MSPSFRFTSSCSAPCVPPQAPFPTAQNGLSTPCVSCALSGVPCTGIIAVDYKSEKEDTLGACKGRDIQCSSFLRRELPISTVLNVIANKCNLGIISLIGDIGRMICAKCTFFNNDFIRFLPAFVPTRPSGRRFSAQHSLFSLPPYVSSPSTPSPIVFLAVKVIRTSRGCDGLFPECSCQAKVIGISTPAEKFGIRGRIVRESRCHPKKLGDVRDRLLHVIY